MVSDPAEVWLEVNVMDSVPSPVNSPKASAFHPRCPLAGGDLPDLDADFCTNHRRALRDLSSAAPTTDILVEPTATAIVLTPLTPHVARNTSGRSAAIVGRAIRHGGCAVGQRIRKRIEEAFSWIKTLARQVRLPRLIAGAG